MSLSGNLKTMDLAELLQWVTLGRKTGSLIFVRNKIKNSILFRDGRIISSRSNEPSKQLGHFLLFQGKLTEVQLKKVLELQLKTRAMLGKILVQQGFVTQLEIEQALIRRTEEVIYDLFLWEDGYFHFAAEGYSLDEVILINIDINAIIFEGVRRKDEWVRIREVFPGNDTVLMVRDGVDLKSLSLTPLQKKLLFLVTVGKPISQMVLESHGSEFLVCYQLFQLYDSGVIDVKEAPTRPEPGEDPAKLLSEGIALMDEHRNREAIEVFREVLRTDPRNPTALEQIERAEQAVCQDLYQSSIPAHKVPYFAVPEAALSRHHLTQEEGFVASRINGAWDVKSIVMLSPLREIEILEILDKLLKMELIALR